MQLNLYVYVLKCSRDEACSRQMMDTGLVLMYGAAYDAGQKRDCCGGWGRFSYRRRRRRGFLGRRW